MSDVDKPLTPTIDGIAISGVSHKAAGGPASSLADNRRYTVQITPESTIIKSPAFSEKDADDN